MKILRLDLEEDKMEGRQKLATYLTELTVEQKNIIYILYPEFKPVEEEIRRKDFSNKKQMSEEQEKNIMREGYL
jgi:hypothetical protein